MIGVKFTISLLLNSFTGPVKFGVKWIQLFISLLLTYLFISHLWRMQFNYSFAFRILLGFDEVLCWISTIFVSLTWKLNRLLCRSSKHTLDYFRSNAWTLNYTRYLLYDVISLILYNLRNICKWFRGDEFTCKLHVLRFLDTNIVWRQ